MGKRYSTSDYLYGMNGGSPMNMGDAMGFIGQMMAAADEANKQRANEQAGIVKEGNYYGVPTKGISFMFDNIELNSGFYVGTDDNGKTVFDKDGKCLFSCLSYNYLGKNIFLVTTEEPKKGSSSAYGALYKDGVKLTKDLFRSQMHSKFKADHCVLGYKEFGGECVVNTNGKVVFDSGKRFISIYIHNNIATEDGKYYNLFTGELICERSYKSSLETGNLMFVETCELVYKIDTMTGEFEIFGEPKLAPQTNDIRICNNSPVTVAEVLPAVLKQQRNDKCACKSGKKYKNCCGGK